MKNKILVEQDYVGFELGQDFHIRYLNECSLEMSFLSTYGSPDFAAMLAMQKGSIRTVKYFLATICRVFQFGTQKEREGLYSLAENPDLYSPETYAIRWAFRNNSFGSGGYILKRCLHTVEDRQFAWEILQAYFGDIVFDTTWITANVKAIAKLMHDTHDCNYLPVLLDALRDAGCEDERILNTTHLYPGCKLLNTILGIES